MAPKRRRSIAFFFQNWQKLRDDAGMPKCPVCFSIEGEEDFGDLQNISIMRDYGLAAIQLHHDHPTRYFDPFSGLTDDGIALLEKVEQESLLLDLSHLSGALLSHVLNKHYAQKIVSHVVCADIQTPSPFARANALTKTELVNCNAILYGMPFLDDLISFSAYLKCVDRKVGIGAVSKHIIAVAQEVGVERVALGPDYFEYKLISDSVSNSQNIEVDTVKGLETTEGLNELAKELRQDGLDDSEIDAVFWGNASEVLTPYLKIWND